MTFNSAADLYTAFNRAYGSFLIISQSVANKFFNENKGAKFMSGSEDYILDLFKDYVCSQSLYEEGCEECW